MTPPAVVRNQVAKESGLVLVPDVGYGRKLVGSFTRPVTPSKLNACPTLPGTNVTPLPVGMTPFLAPMVSLALPSPRYKFIRLGRNVALVLPPPVSFTVRSTT